MAANGAHLAQFINEQHGSELGIFFWSYSTTKLIGREIPRSFIEFSLPKDWLRFPTSIYLAIALSDDPADDSSRGYEVQQMNAAPRWLSRSSFLRSEVKEQPFQRGKPKEYPEAAKAVTASLYMD